MRSIKLAVTYEDGVYTASGREETPTMTYSIVAEGSSWEALKSDVQEVIAAVYYDTARPDLVTLDLILHDELLVA